MTQLSTEAQFKLIELCDAPVDAVCEVIRKSKWGVQINVVVGLRQYGSFKVNARTRKFERIA